MRFVSLIPAVAAALLLSATAHAQMWEEYVNRGAFFQVNFPGEPVEKEITYKTPKGTSLPARVFTAQDARGIYSITVVDYNSATAEGPTAVEDAAKTIRAMGTSKYEGVNMLDMHRSWRMTVETPGQRRILAEILVSAANRLYISQADTPLTAAPPAQFQASLQVLDANGVRIRNRTVEGITPDEVVPVTPQQRAIDIANNEKLVAGIWRDVAGGTCEAPFYKAGERTKTSRGEEATNGTITYRGVTINGQLIILGPRVGQFIDPMSLTALMLFDPSPGKITFSSLNGPAVGWPDVTLAKCQG